MSLAGWPTVGSKKAAIIASRVDAALTDFPVRINISGLAGRTGFDLRNIIADLCPVVVNDAFTGTDGDAPKKNLWGITNNSASGTIAVSSNKLRIVVPSVASNENIVAASKYKISGDFDIQVDYAEVSSDAPSSGLTYLSRLAVDDGTNYAQVGNRLDSASTKSMYVNGSSDTETTCTPNYTAGKLRLVRSGSTIKGYYWTGSQWEWNGSTAGYTFTTTSSNDVNIEIETVGGLDSGVTTDFDNFTVNSGTVTWPEYTNCEKIAVEDVATGNQCYVEVEQWDADNRAGQLWVKVPAVSNTADTTLVVYVDPDHDDNTTYVGQVGTTAGQSVWDSNFVAVYHMNQDPSGGTGAIKDSTSYASHGTSAGSMTSGDLVTGQIGDALDYDGSDDYINIGCPLPAGTGSFTINAIIKSVTTATRQQIVSVGSTATNAGAWFYINTSNKLAFDLSNTAGPTSTNDVTGSFKDVALVNDAGAVQPFISGVADGSPSSMSPNITATEGALGAALPSYQPTSFFGFDGIIDEVRISNIARSNAHIKATYYSNTDSLITYGDATSVSNWLAQPYGTGVVSEYLEQSCGLMLGCFLEQPYMIPFFKQNYIEQSCGLVLGGYLSQPYGNVPVVMGKLYQYYGDTAQLVSSLVQRYDDALQLQSYLEQPYQLPGYLISALEQRYAITQAEVSSFVEQIYDLYDRDLVRRILAQPYIMAAGDSIRAAVNATVVIDGIALDPFHINIEATENDYRITGEIHTYKASDYHQVDEESFPTAVITINGQEYNLVVDNKYRRRQAGKTTYVIECASRAILMDLPHASTLQQKFDPDLASNIAQDLATPFGVTVDWQCVDWQVPAESLYANDESPLEVIKKLKTAAGAILQSQPDSTLLVRPLYPVSLPEWDQATPDLYLTDNDNFWTVDEQPDPRDGYNKFVISNQLAATDSMRLEEIDVSGDTKHIKAYIVPWENRQGVTLSSSRVDVIPEPLAVDPDDLEITETIEIVNGTGSTSDPIYELLSVSWQDTVLGAITFSEDGTIVTEVKGQSLLEITYRTRYLLWRAVDKKIEDVQFVLEAES